MNTGTAIDTMVGPITEADLHDWLTFALLDHEGRRATIVKNAYTDAHGRRTYTLTIAPAEDPELI